MRKNWGFFLAAALFVAGIGLSLLGGGSQGQGPMTQDSGSGRPVPATLTATPSSAPEGFVVDMLLPTTPDRDQGNSELCWIYAMQAAIETDRLAMGDSVVLSPIWVERKSLEEQVLRSYFTGEEISLRGTLPEALRLMEEYGVVAETGVVGSQRQGHSSRVLARKAKLLAQSLSASRQGTERLMARLDNMLDDATAPMPRYVFMLGFEYTPQQFFESCCLPGEWRPFTSFTHHPYGREFDIEIKDNRQRHKVMNIQCDSLLRMVHTSLTHRHPVAWEGCIGSQGQGPMTQGSGSGRPISAVRQRLFETGKMTDDHCMTIIGSGHDKTGTRYFICKNSWAGRTRVYMTEKQFLLSTILIMVKK